jgi:RNA polymerase sigma-70 factor (ECF subfamily)
MIGLSVLESSAEWFWMQLKNGVNKLHPWEPDRRLIIEQGNLSVAARFDMSLCACNDFSHLFCLYSAGLEQSEPAFFERVNDETAPDQDVELLRRVAAGDRAAFADFYDRHSTLMFSVACKILNDPNEAQDVLQETFLQIWEKAERFDPKLGKASSWAATLTRNKAIDRIRASVRRSRLADEAGAESAIVAEVGDTANEALHGHDKAKLIQSAITGLPAEQRRAIELAYFSGLTQHEISEQLKEPLGTIKARIRRGLLKLRDQLEGLL